MYVVFLRQLFPVVTNVIKIVSRHVEALATLELAHAMTCLNYKFNLDAILGNVGAWINSVTLFFVHLSRRREQDQPWRTTQSL